MANELMNVPNWGVEEMVVYKSPYDCLGKVSKSTKLHYYFLLKVFNNKLHDIKIMYHATVPILMSIERMSKMDGSGSSQFNFSRFIKPTLSPKEFFWRNRLVAVVPFEGYVVSRALLQYMKFMGIDRKQFRFGGWGDEYWIDFGQVYDTLEYHFDNDVRKNTSRDWEQYLDYWVKCVIHDVKKGRIYLGENSAELNKQFAGANR